LKKILIIYFVFLVLFQFNIFAEGNGGYAGAFLRMGLGAKSIAMGNTGVADEPNAYSAFYNPAIYGFMQDKKVGLSHSFLSLDRHVNYISYSMNIPPGAGFSIGWMETGVGDLKSYNSIGLETGEINQTANSVFFSFGRAFSEKLAVGVTIKILWEYINDGTEEFDYGSNGVGIDLGVLYKFNDELTFGYQLRDLKSKFKANTDKIFNRGGTTIDLFPLMHKIGGSYKTPVEWLRVNYEFEWSNKKDYIHHIGAEALWAKNLALRLGMDDTHFTYGGGMDFSFMGTVSFLDYAFQPSIIDEGSSHLFSWQISF